MEAASNGGYMLKNFAQRGIPVLGIDLIGCPATAGRSRRPTMITFFTRDLAQQLVEEERPTSSWATTCWPTCPNSNGL